MNSVTRSLAGRPADAPLAVGSRGAALLRPAPRSAARRACAAAPRSGARRTHDAVRARAVAAPGPFQDRVDRARAGWATTAVTALASALAVAALLGVAHWRAEAGEPSSPVSVVTRLEGSGEAATTR